MPSKRSHQSKRRSRSRDRSRSRERRRQRGGKKKDKEYITEFAASSKRKSSSGSPPPVPQPSLRAEIEQTRARMRAQLGVAEKRERESVVDQQAIADIERAGFAPASFQSSRKDRLVENIPVPEEPTPRATDVKEKGTVLAGEIFSKENLDVRWERFRSWLQDYRIKKDIPLATG